MNINPIPYANQEKDRVIRVKKKHRENKVRILLLIVVLGISANFAFAECTEYMQAFNKHQLVMKGLLDLTLEGNIDKPTVDAIAVRQKEAIKYQDAGEYQKACEIYDSILSDYNFDKSFGKAPAPKSDETSAPTESSSTSSTSSESEASKSSLVSNALKTSRSKLNEGGGLAQT